MPNLTSPPTVGHLTADELRRNYGASQFNGTDPTDDVIALALDAFGEAVHRVRSVSQGAMVADEWVAFLRRFRPTIDRPAEIVRAAISAGLSAPLGNKEPQTDFQAPTVAEWVDLIGDRPAADWLVPGYLARGCVTVLAGLGKGGKSTFTSNLAAGVACGAPVLDRPITAGPVLWLDLEQGINLTLAKYQALGIGTEPVRIHNDRNWRYSAAKLAQLRAFVREHGIILVIVDSLSKYWRGLVEKEEDNVQVETAMATLIELARDTNAAVLPIHHFRKNGTGSPDLTDIRGAGSIINTADIVIGFGRPKGAARDTTQRVLEAISRYDETPKAFVVDWQDGLYVPLGPELVATRNDMHRRALAAINGQDEELTAQEIAEALGMEKSTSTLRDALKELYAEEKVNRTGEGKAGSAFRYSRKGLSAEGISIEQTDRQTQEFTLPLTRT